MSRLIAVALGLIGSMAAGIIGGPPPAEAAPQGKVVIAQGVDPTTLDPQWHEETPAYNVLLNIYDTLLFRDKDLKIIPWLAESWKLVNPTTWEFKLRKAGNTTWDADGILGSTRGGCGPGALGRPGDAAFPPRCPSHGADKAATIGTGAPGSRRSARDPERVLERVHDQAGHPVRVDRAAKLRLARGRVLA